MQQLIEAAVLAEGAYIIWSTFMRIKTKAYDDKANFY